jgi:hypothetical protein
MDVEPLENKRTFGASRWPPPPERTKGRALRAPPRADVRVPRAELEAPGRSARQSVGRGGGGTRTGGPGGEERHHAQCGLRYEPRPFRLELHGRRPGASRAAGLSRCGRRGAPTNRGCSGVGRQGSAAHGRRRSCRGPAARGLGEAGRRSQARGLPRAAGAVPRSRRTAAGGLDSAASAAGTAGTAALRRGGSGRDRVRRRRRASCS